MRSKLYQNKEKLIPLRRFAVEGLYNVPYLSVLVQRNKLKAQKIGRNYYTTKNWFKEYLDFHSRDSKRQDYYQFLETLDENLNQSIETKKIIKKLASNQQKKSDGREVGFFVWPRKWLAIRTILGFVITLVIISSLYLISLAIKNQGQVAGVEESGTSTTVIINPKK